MRTVSITLTAPTPDAGMSAQRATEWQRTEIDAMQQLINHFVDEFRAGSVAAVVSAIHQAAEHVVEFQATAAEDVLTWLAARRKQEAAK